MKGWRRVIQMWRAAATSGRFCSAACRSFFVCQTEVAQEPPDRAATHYHAMRGRDLSSQSSCRQVPLLCDPASNPVLQGGQLTMPAAVALGLRHKAPGRLHQLDHVIDKLDRDLEPRRRRPVRVPFRHMVHNTLPKFYRMRLTHR